MAGEREYVKCNYCKVKKHKSELEPRISKGGIKYYVCKGGCDRKPGRPKNIENASGVNADSSNSLSYSDFRQLDEAGANGGGALLERLRVTDYIRLTNFDKAKILLLKLGDILPENEYAIVQEMAKYYEA